MCAWDGPRLFDSYPYLGTTIHPYSYLISPSHATHPSNNIRGDGMVGTITELNKFADNKLSQIGGNLERFEQ